MMKRWLDGWRRNRPASIENSTSWIDEAENQVIEVIKSRSKSIKNMNDPTEEEQQLIDAYKSLQKNSDLLSEKDILYDLRHDREFREMAVKFKNRTMHTDMHKRVQNDRGEEKDASERDSTNGQRKGFSAEEIVKRPTRRKQHATSNFVKTISKSRIVPSLETIPENQQNLDTAQYVEDIITEGFNNVVKGKNKVAPVSSLTGKDSYNHGKGYQLYSEGMRENDQNKINEGMRLMKEAVENDAAGYKTGGRVKKTGRALVHKDEFVLPKGVKATKKQKQQVAKIKRSKSNKA